MPVKLSWSGPPRGFQFVSKGSAERVPVSQSLAFQFSLEGEFKAERSPGRYFLHPSNRIPLHILMDDFERAQ
jgi:hypothetical protein